MTNWLWLAAAVAAVLLPWVLYRVGLRLFAGPRRCWGCKEFDYDSGQAALRQHPPFWAAAQHLSPAQMARSDGAESYPVWAKWSQFGACLCPKRTTDSGGVALQWGGDSCEHHQLVPVRDLVRRRQLEDEARRGVLL